MGRFSRDLINALIFLFGYSLILLLFYFGVEIVYWLSLKANVVSILLVVVAITILVFLYIYLGVIFLRIKVLHRRSYGTLEVGLGTLSGLLAIMYFKDPSLKNIIAFFGFYTGLYVMVRGLENIKSAAANNRNPIKFLCFDLNKNRIF